MIVKLEGDLFPLFLLSTVVIIFNNPVPSPLLMLLLYKEIFFVFKYKLLNCLFSFFWFESKAKVKTSIFNLLEMLLKFDINEVINNNNIKPHNMQIATYAILLIIIIQYTN